MKRLSESFYTKIKSLEPLYATKQALLLPALHAAQDELGWLSQETLNEIAVLLFLHPAQVRETASFYTMFYLKPVGKHVLRICTNVACHLNGAEEILKRCEKKLGIKVGETTADCQFTLFEEECLGACGTAPAAFVDKDYHERLTVEKIDTLIDSMKVGNE